MNTTSLKIMADAVCRKMDIDRKGILQLSEIYPKNILFVTAEHIARNSVDVSKKIFEFLGLDFIQNDVTRITDLSSWSRRHRKRKENDFNPFKNDGYASSMKWRKSMTMEVKTVIDSICLPTHKQFGYLTMENVQYFRNISNTNTIPSKQPNIV